MFVIVAAVVVIVAVIADVVAVVVVIVIFVPVVLLLLVDVSRLALLSPGSFDGCFVVFAVWLLTCCLYFM